MFTANTTGLLTHYTGTDKFGQSLYEAPGTVVPCAVVKLQPIIQKTPIRSTASASRRTSRSWSPATTECPASPNPTGSWPRSRASAAGRNVR